MEATRGCLLLWPVRLTVSRLLVLGQVWGVRQLPCELALRGDGAFCWAAPARAPGTTAALRSDRPAAAPPGGSRRFRFGALAASPRPAFSVYLGRYALASRRRLSDVTYTPRALFYPPRGVPAHPPRAARSLRAWPLWRGQSIRHIRGIPRAAPARPGARGRLNISFRREPERPPHKARHNGTTRRNVTLCGHEHVCADNDNK